MHPMKPLTLILCIVVGVLIARVIEGLFWYAMAYHALGH